MPIEAKIQTYMINPGELGLLKLEPLNGYAIRQEARTSTNLFWSELKYGHIYPALQGRDSSANPQKGQPLSPPC